MARSVALGRFNFCPFGFIPVSFEIYFTLCVKHNFMLCSHLNLGYDADVIRRPNKNFYSKRNRVHTTY